MPFNTIRNEEPADAREALLRYCLSKNIKNTMPSQAMADYRKSSSLKKPRLGQPSLPPRSISKTPSPYSPPSLVFSPSTSPDNSPVLTDYDYIEDVESPPPIFPETEFKEDLSSDSDVQEHARLNNEYIQQLEQLSMCGAPQPRFPYNGYRLPSFLGDEQQVERILFYWDGGLGYVPEEDVHEGIMAFEADVPLEKMEPETCAALIHILSLAMSDGRLRHDSTTTAQILYFLSGMYRAVAKDQPGHPSTRPPIKEHWLQGTQRDRKEEVEWLKLQAEKRFWLCHNQKVHENYQRSLEPPENELQGLFDQFIQA